MRESDSISNGSGAAALLAAATGWGVLGALAVAADRLPALSRLLVFYRPTGPLSGVTTIAVVVWICLWLVLDRRWRSREVNMRGVCVAAFLLLATGLLLTFPPFADLL